MPFHRVLTLSTLSLALSTLITPQCARQLTMSTSRSLKPPTAVTLVTFDVDGTLVKGSSSAPEVTVHAKAFLHAAGRVAGNEDAFETKHDSPLDFIAKENYHGCTDGLISLHLMKNAFGLPAALGAQKLDAVFECMHAFVSKVDDADITRTIVPIDGVFESLARLRDEEVLRGSVLCGLVTGNVEGIARKKMRATGLFNLRVLCPAALDQQGSYPGTEECAFLGGFGSDFCSGDIEDISRQHRDRGEQILIALRRAQSLLSETQRIVRVVHVGDAPADVLAARFCVLEKPQEGVSFGCVGVATGSYSAADLRHACGQHVPGRWEPVVLERGVPDSGFVKALGIPTDC